jgi:serine/threonine protein kinase
MLESGSLLGPYKIQAPLGKGGMGEVYRAQDTRLGRAVAIKVLPPHLTQNEGALHRFEREAKALAALSHPNILTIFDVGVDRGISFVVMELLQGDTLRSRIRKTGIPWQETLQIAIPIAEALAAAHANGVIHRDLKPENIFVTTTGVPKVLDFGLARWKEAMPNEGVTSLPTAPLETPAGIVMGTLPYMSPEQARGEPVEASSDIFSFGCVLFEMLSGVQPFAGNSSAEIIAAVLKETPSLTGSGDVPLPLAQIVDRCLRKDPKERFHSANDLAFALKTLTTSPVTAMRTLSKASVFSIRMRTALIMIAGIVLMIVLISQIRKPKSAADSIAVLPFVNEAGPDMEYLSDGISENITNRLSQLPKLKVISRTSAFRYKGKKLDPKELRDELDVQTVLIGKISRRAQLLAVSAELVNTSDNTQLWGQQYNRSLDDIFSVEQDISKEIVRMLKLKLGEQEENQLVKRNTQNTEAYQNFLKGPILLVQKNTGRNPGGTQLFPKSNR